MCCGLDVELFRGLGASKVNKLFFAAAAFAAMATVSSAAGAVTYIDTGAAQADITLGSNSITVVLTSLTSNPTSAGDLLSGIEIFLDDAPTTATLTSQSGVLIDVAKGGAVTNVTGNPTHWSDALSGTEINLATVGLGGAKPKNLIIDGDGDYSNANASIPNFKPLIKGAGTFVLTLTGAATPTIDHVVFEFGTGPDSTAAGTCTVGCSSTPPPGVPEPAAWALMILGFGGAGAMLRRRRAVLA
jgi:hypothetical protein